MNKDCKCGGRLHRTDKVLGKPDTDPLMCHFECDRCHIKRTQRKRIVKKPASHTFDYTKVIIVSSDATKDRYVIRDHAKRLYDAGLLSYDIDNHCYCVNENTDLSKL